MIEHGCLKRARRKLAPTLFSLFLLSACNSEANLPGVYGDSCRTGDPNHLCLAVKYVAYRGPTGAPAVALSDAIFNVQQTNQLWAQCNLGFQIEQYQAVDPASVGLTYNTANFADLDIARRKFRDPRALLVVTTGAWNRTGSLGDSKANAWTSLPEAGPFGTVLEQPVGRYSYIVAHELGHYLNLLHENNTTDLMNPVIYTTSTALDNSQCATARSAALAYWIMAMR